MTTLPTVNAYNKITNLLSAIRNKPTPDKLTQDKVKTVFDLKSSSYFAMLPLLKKLDMLGGGNQPTSYYKEYKNSSTPKIIFAKAVKSLYSSLFALDEKPYELNEDKLIEKICLVESIDKENEKIATIKGTFLALCKESDFTQESSALSSTSTEPVVIDPNKFKNNLNNLPIDEKMQLSYVINLVLPNSTESEVFDTIFQSLKRNLLI